MKAILVIEMPDSYADKYNINEMYVWDLVVQDKNGYQMFNLTTDKPSHLKLMPKMLNAWDYQQGWNDCIKEIER